MTPQELRNSILQLAFEGKLVFNSKENSETLIKEIVQFKLKRELKQKKYQSINFVKKPFELPKNWRWVYLSDIASINGGYAFKSTDYKDDGVRIVRISDFNENGFIDNKIVRTHFSSNIIDYKIEFEDILLCMTGGTVGKSYFVRQLKEDMFTNQRVATIKILNPLKSFIYYAILAPFTQKVINDSKNSTNDNISMDLINTFLIPLPPLEEQKRIVAKIEELLPLVDKYEEAWTRLEKFNNQFPNNIEKAILQLATEGKLSLQSQNKNNAKELLDEISKRRSKLITEKKLKTDKRLFIKEISKEDEPFRISENWVWTNFGSLLYKLTDGTHSTPKYADNGIKFISVKDMSSGKIDFGNCKFISEEEHKLLYQRCNPMRGDILLSKVGTTGVPAIVDTDEEFSLFVSVALLKFDNTLIDTRFLYYLIQSPVVQKQAQLNTRGVGNKNWVLDDISNTIVPLPPFEEQKRIVAKIEELLPLCRSLK